MTIQDPLNILLDKENKKRLFNALSKIYPYLTAQQVSILKLLALGCTYVDTAKPLNIEPTNIYKLIDAIPIRLKRFDVDLSELDEILHK